MPFQSGTLTYNGSEQSPVWNGFHAAAMETSGMTSAVNAGTYTAIFTPKTGYQWPDGTTGAKPEDVPQAAPGVTAERKARAGSNHPFNGWF